MFGLTEYTKIKVTANNKKMRAACIYMYLDLYVSLSSYLYLYFNAPSLSRLFGQAVGLYLWGIA